MRKPIQCDFFEKIYNITNARIHEIQQTRIRIVQGKQIYKSA